MKKLILPAFGISILPILTQFVFDEKNVSTANNFTISTALVLLGGLLIFLLAIYWLKKKHFNGRMDFKKIFTEGLKMTFISAMIIALFLFVYFSFINPEFIDNLRKTQEANVLKTSENSTKEIKLTLKMIGFFITPTGVIISTFFSRILGGSINSLIAAILFRNRETKA